MSNTFKGGWYLLYVKSRFERKVKKLLLEEQFKVFLPLVKTTRQWSDRKKVIEVPLFPSYLFVEITSKNSLSRALSIQGACVYIRFGNEFAIAHQSEIDRIKCLVNLKGLEDITISDCNLLRGEKYVIQSGPLVGLECEIIQGSKNKIIVRVESIRQNVIVTLPKSHLLGLCAPC